MVDSEDAQPLVLMSRGGHARRRSTRLVAILLGHRGTGTSGDIGFTQQFLGAQVPASGDWSDCGVVDCIPTIFFHTYRQTDTSEMPVGTIKKLVADRGFGFIETTKGDLFFHMSSVQEARFEDLREGQKVEYTEGEGPRGPRAEAVKPSS